LVVTVSLAFLYYMTLFTLMSLARQHVIPGTLAVWTPNLILALAGVIAATRLDRAGDRDIVGAVRDRLERAWHVFRGTLPRPSAPAVPAARARATLLPQIIDNYVLGTFLFYFALLLTSFILMTQVYQFFELLSDVFRNNIAISRVFVFLFFLTPKLIYDTVPVSILVAVLVTFGVLTKSNEVTAMKACGVSLYRLALPVLITSALLSGGLFAFDHYIVPDANVRQDAIRNEIKGRPVQTYLRPDRKWIFGQGSRIYYYKHFDQSESVMLGVQVYELDPATFRLTRHISAERAHWDFSLNTWVFYNGWSRDLHAITRETFRDFSGATATFSDLNEAPGYFLQEVKQAKQMNYGQLSSYIAELRQSGFDTVKLQVQYHKKFSVPLFALIMALISVPFAFLTGSRGAMAGVGVSLGIAVGYWALNLLFEQIGNVNQLPPALAAWSPDAVFSVAGLYMMARMRT
jgi:LPS export ABC transporter permease LptG